jgi:hypothetical protein
MIRKINDNPEIYEHTDRNGVKTYRIEDKPWGSGGKFLSEQEFKSMHKKEKSANE